MRFQLICILGLLLLLSACKRYEDGPLISLKSPEKRLANSWQYNLVLKNGRNVTKGEGEVSINFAKSSIGFEESGRFSVLWESDSGDLEYDGFWNLNDKKDKLSLDYIEDSIQDIELKILRLKNDEFWFSETINDVLFEYRCSPN